MKTNEFSKPYIDVIKELNLMDERKQHETIDDFLKNCEILIKQALIDYVCHK